ncbi:MFS transporter [Paraburkholderia phymatum]|uniref:MFS transporter n=1 Tax=Paraburkholderia phymatum TaxID=148447 RepID=UPI003182A00A
MQQPARSRLAFGLVTASTVVGTAGTDLVLPAVSGMPISLGCTLEQAQYVLAAFTAGAALGLYGFGELGARGNQRELLAGALGLYAGTSILCALSPTFGSLIGLRFIQGVTASCAAVFAPGMIRAIYGNGRAIAALGLLGSAQAIAAALAPVAGLWLVRAFGWRASFAVIATFAGMLAVATTTGRHLLPACSANAGKEVGYARLLCSWAFMRQALSYALTVAALLVFVFGVPTVITNAMGGHLYDFIVLQVCGILCFIVANSTAAPLTRRFGASRLITGGTLISVSGGWLLSIYALAGGSNIWCVTTMVLLLDIGMGLRGPAGLHAAMLAADGDDARAASLVGIGVLALTAFATAMTAPFISVGLVAIALASAILAGTALVLLVIPLAKPTQVMAES